MTGIDRSLSCDSGEKQINRMEVRNGYSRRGCGEHTVLAFSRQWPPFFPSFPSQPHLNSEQIR